MIDTLLQSLAPHYCYGCGVIGTSLCGNCKYDIISEPFLGCLACGHLAGRHGLCAQCQVPYQKAWCSAERSGVVERLIDDYKFEYVQAIHRVLGDLLLETLDDLPRETIIVPIPTISPHIRQRGYDHTLLVARYIGRKRQLAVRPLLGRAHSTVQHGAGRVQRIAQAKQAFIITSEVEADRPYLLLDDIVTTGATIRYAAQTLHNAGAQYIWVAAVARQSLD